MREKPRQGIVVQHDRQRRAYAVVDAIEMLEVQMQPFRAVEALAMNEKLGTEESLGALRRSDLALLICVLTKNVENHFKQARELAAKSANEVMQ